MASSAFAMATVNGATSHQDSTVPINSAQKRKRDTSDDGEAEADEAQASKPAVNGVHKALAQKSLIRDFFDALQSLDIKSHAILKRPLPDSLSDNEPSAKRSKSEDDPEKALSIQDKVNQDAYDVLDDLVVDINKVVKAQVAEFENGQVSDGTEVKSEAIARAIELRNNAKELFRREVAYPLSGREQSSKPEGKNEIRPGDGNRIALMSYGMAPTLKPVFTSLQRPKGPADDPVKPLVETALPNGVSFAHIAQGTPASSERNHRTPTLGELFPSPRNLPPLQPPKAAKTSAKSNVLTFYHPEPAEKSRYRAGSYFSMNLSSGTWLDYSNATPTTHAKTKQRERAQSLAGHKPSSVELEMSEMEALFRGAFSSFAPTKDDAGAIIPTGQVSRMWWRRVGCRNFDKLVDAEVLGEDAEKGGEAVVEVDTELDDSMIEDALENWDDSLVDPNIDRALGTKSAEEKDVDDLLEEVTDLIETLASHHRNRNLVLPTSQDRYSGEAATGDMLRHGSVSHQPTEEEMTTYEALRAQLSLIVNMLPPYAVARLNSDKLEELNVSTKIEVRTDEYKGVMEEDEPARLARQAQQQAAQTANQRTQQRSSSVSSGGVAYPAAGPQYGSPYPPNSHRPVPPAQYPHTPVRPPPPNVYGQRQPSAVPIPQPHISQPRPPATQPHRPPPNGYGYGPQIPRPQVPGYGTPNMQYGHTPVQPRTVTHPGYQNPAPMGSPNPRYTASYPGGYPQHQQPQQHQPQHQHQMHPQQMQHQHQHHQHVQPPHHAPPPHHQQPPHVQHAQHAQFPPQPQQGHAPSPAPQPPNYGQYANGGQVPRNMSPQVPPAHAFSPSPTPQHQQQHQQHQPMSRPPYGSPAQGMPPTPSQHHYGSGPAVPGSGMTPGGVRPTGAVGYNPMMNDHQHRQMMEQASARVRAQQLASGQGVKAPQGEIAGLAGIGLGGNVDVHKIAAAKAMHMGGAMSPSPKLAMQPGPNAVNGTGMPPTAPSPAPIQGSSVSPAPGPGFKPPA